MDEEIYVCEGCGYESENFDDFRRFNGRLYCENCYYVCDHCGHVCLHTYTTNDGLEICENCMYDYYYRCENCGELIHEDDTYTYRGDVYCSDCFSELERDDDIIRDYHDNPTLLCRSMDDSEDKRSYWSDDLQLIGLEIEMQGGCVHDTAVSIHQHLQNETIGYICHDGSLDDGIEVISMPMTKEFFDKVFPLDKICASAIYHGMEAHYPEEPGLHIHLSKCWYGSTKKEQKSTIMNLIHILDKYRSKWLKVSRRPKGSYDSWSEPYNLKYPQNYDEIMDRNSHYQIISIRNNTVELRMFKGSIVEHSIRSAVEFYIRIVDLCKTYSFEVIDSLSFDEIRSYISLNSEYVSEYMEKRFRDGFKPDSIINLKIDFRMRRLKLIDNLKSDYFNQAYNEINPEMVSYYHRYFDRYDFEFYPCMPDVLETEYENIHFMSINPVSVNDIECW